MSQYYLLGAFVSLIAWSSAYMPATLHQSAGVQIGSTAQAQVRWTPNPDRGSASSTLSGGRRGASASGCGIDSQLSDPKITLLVPDGVEGLTTEPQPTLSWYLESAQPADMEFVLSHPTKATPVYRQQISAQEGLVEMPLPESAALETGVRYRWTVFLNCEGTDEKVHARSFIERIPESELAVVNTMTSLEQADAYAERGIWYDALNALVSAYRSEAQMSTLLEIRNLLDQANTDVPLELYLATADAP